VTKIVTGDMVDRSRLEIDSPQVAGGTLAAQEVRLPRAIGERREGSDRHPVGRGDEPGGVDRVAAAAEEERGGAKAVAPQIDDIPTVGTFEGDDRRGESVVASQCQ